MRARRGEDSTTFLDFLFLMVLVMLLLVNPKVPPTKSDAPPLGHMVITIDWPEGSTDVDGVIKDPLEPRGVMYSNKTGKNWSLVRDDVGNTNDPTPMNRESYISRAAPAGHYVFNLHLYRGAGPIEVWVEVRLSNVDGGDDRILLTTKATLHKLGQEITVVAFDLTADGAIVPDSANSVFVPLRSATQ